MKKIALVGLLALAGCTTTAVSWQQDNQIEVAQSTVTLKSNLWLNKMPTIGEEQDKNLHGALYLEANNDLPADLAVKSVSIKQGDNTWMIDGDALELRTHNETQWEVAFVWQLAIDNTKTVDVALELEHGGNAQWLVESAVNIDSVY
ncbi:hypothetical protein EK599_15490 [Vibrio sp. T187]|uniref:hypothetical protein n=1 Tax=Vibrio TaxID=662 RepID=UPI0010CA1A17|nr:MULTISPECIES: hypothetical protein [Vibrio]MBW3697103.1 hypothetical protein [Vibrio sp. T187]